jgi:hypothetical protein
LANNPHFKLSTRNKVLDDVTTSLGTSAVFLIYAGTQPADASTAVTAANTIVASLACPSTNAFGAAAAGVITANTITSDSSAAGGTAGWAALVMANATTRVVDMSVGTSGADLNLNSVTISTGAAVAISSFTITFAA